MRLNRYLATHAGLSRREADQAIADGKVKLNRRPAELGQQVQPGDEVFLEDQPVTPTDFIYLALHKPVGYVVSRNSQGGTTTIYDLLPKKHHGLKYAGRLDKDSSGLLVLTNDGGLIQQTAHPGEEKIKHYLAKLNRPLAPSDRERLEQGVELEDGPSRLGIRPAGDDWSVRISEGRNRQIRRTFSALGYKVTELKRIGYARLELGDLAPGQFREVKRSDVL